MSTVKISKLIWDESNTKHIAKHSVVPEEVEEICGSKYVVRPTHKNRLMIIGLTDKGRMLSIIIEKEDLERYYVVSARSVDKKERTIYYTEKEN